MQKIHILFLFVVIQISASINTCAQIDSLRIKLQKIVDTKSATEGVAVLDFNKKDTVSLLGNTHFPMQSVFKFHIGLAVLHQVDKHKLSLDQKISIDKNQFLENTWSPIQKKYPDGNVTLTLAEVLQYTVSQSDNFGCDVLLRLLGGPAVVEKYIRSLGIQDIAIEVNEEIMHKTWDAQFKNWTTPHAAVTLLYQFYNNRKMLSEKSRAFLLEAMIQTFTGKKRIKGQLPAETEVAHKTGTSGTNEAGIMAAVNDIGIVTLPDGNRFAIAVFVSSTKESMDSNERIIAELSRAVYDYFINKNH